MIRRSWVIYRKKSKQTVSTIYHRLASAREDLCKLNEYCGSKLYAIQVTRKDSQTGMLVSRYPNIKLKPLPEIQGKDYG